MVTALSDLPSHLRVTAGYAVGGTEALARFWMRNPSLVSRVTLELASWLVGGGAST